MTSHFNHSNTTAATPIDHHSRHDHPSSTPSSTSARSSLATTSNEQIQTGLGGELASATSSTPCYPKPQISNLTKNLLNSHSHSSFTGDSGSTQLPLNPPSYSSSINTSSKVRFIPNDLTNNQSYGSFNSNNGFQQYTPNDNINYIPSSHNTPTVVSTSYSSNHSYTASLPSSQSNNNFISQAHSSSFRPPVGIVPHAIPTTNVFTDTATTNRGSFSSSSSSFTQSGFSIPNQYQPPAPHSMQSHSLHRQLRFPSSLPANNTTNASSSSFRLTQPQPIEHEDRGSSQLSHPQASSYLNITPQPIVTDRLVPTSGASTLATSTPLEPPNNLQQQGLLVNIQRSASHSASSLTDQPIPELPQPPKQLDPYVPPEPDHYMTYSEFLKDLIAKDSSETASDEHLNIVDYPVNDLIVMLSCLLTKIIEANDKLHPNHFENTIAIRQRLKNEKKKKKLQRKKQQEVDSDDIDVDHDYQNEDERKRTNDADGDQDMDFDDDSNDDDDDDDDDEIKNKYLANVLAFHGTNVPGITLHAYLSRVLKYCPVTNEVFLSLLVYFDRIAKKANNLNQQKKRNGDSNNQSNGTEQSESEQLFVMDSYNIHRLVISGITVSSKFFLDIFYKNLRYAKVGGLPLEELNYLELQFLLLLDFKLMISVEDLQNYGDLLLRFWKREQITNELVNKNNPEDAKQEIKS